MDKVAYSAGLFLLCALVCCSTYWSTTPRNQKYQIPATHHKISTFSLSFDAQIIDFPNTGYLVEHLTDPHYQEEITGYFENELRSAGLMVDGDRDGIQLRCGYTKASGSYFVIVYLFKTKISMDMRCCIAQMGWCDVFQAEGIGTPQDGSGMNSANARVQESLARQMIVAVSQQLQ